MTPTDPGSAGELYVSVTGDISALLTALDDATAEASKAGEEIASALTSPTGQMNFDFGEKLSEQFAQVAEGAKTAGETFEQFSQRMHDAAPPASAFSEAAQEVIDKQAHLGREMLASVEAFDQIQQAFLQGKASILDVARAQEEMAQAFERANPLEHEAAEGMGELAGKFGEFAGKLGIAVGLEEIGREALKAYSHVQDLTTAFTFMTGSAEKANEPIAQLKEIGIALAVPTEKLEDAARRMSVSLGGFDKVVPALKDAADIAALTGKSFDAVAHSIETMALSGNAGSRQLVALGIDSARLGEAMETTAAGAAKAFKALSDPEQRLEVLHVALAKTGGAAEAMAKNLSGSFTIFRNEVDDTMEEVGKAIEPLASTLLQAFSGVLSATRPVIAAMAEIASSSIKQSLEEFTTAAEDFGFALSHIPFPEVQAHIASLNEEVKQLTTKDLMGWAVELTTHFNVMLAPLQAVTAAMQSIGLAFTLVTGRTKEGDEVLQGFLQSLQPVAPKLTETGESALGYSKALQDVLDKHTKLTEAVKTAASALEEAKGLLSKGAISQEEYNAALANYEKALKALHGPTEKQTELSKAMTAAMKDLAEAPLTVENAMNAMANGVNLETLKTKIQGMIDKIRDLSGVGTVETDKLIEALANGVDRLNGFATSGASAIEKIINAQKKADESVKESKIALDALTISYERQTPLLNGHVATLAEVERAQKSLTSAQSSAGESMKAVGEAAASSAPKMVDVAAALHTASNAYSDTAAKALLSSQNFGESASVIVDGKNKIVSAIQSVNGELGQVLDTSGQVPGEFIKIGDSAIKAASGLHATADGARDVSAAMVDMSGHLQTAASALEEVNAKALAELDIWGQIDAAAGSAGASIEKASNAGGGGRGGGGGSAIGPANLLQIYAAMGAPDSILDGLAAALGLHQTGNRSYETQQEYQDRMRSIDPSGTGASALEALRNAGLSAAAASKELASLEAQVGRTGHSLQSLVDDYIKSLEQATKNAAETVNTAGVSMVTFKQKVDAAGNAIASTSTQASTSWALFGGSSSPGAGGMGIDGLTKNLDDYNTAVQLGAASQQAANDAIAREIEADAAWSASMRAMGDAMAATYAADAAAREATNAAAAKDKLDKAAGEDSSRAADFAAQQAKFTAEREARVKADAEARAAAEKKESDAYQARQSEFAAYWEKVRAQEAALDAIIMPGLQKFNQFFQNFTGSLDKANLAATIQGLDKGMLDGKTFDPLAYLKPIDPKNVYGSNAMNFGGVPSNVNPGPFAGQPGVNIQITGNAITSQDSAQRLASTLVGALRNNAGLKLG